MSSTTPLPVGVGYGVVVGIGFFFAAVMCGISYIQVGALQKSQSTQISQDARIVTLDSLPRRVKSSILPAGV